MAPRACEGLSPVPLDYWTRDKLAAAVREAHGDLSGAFSRRITIQQRLVYQVLADEGVVKVIRMWTDYE